MKTFIIDLGLVIVGIIWLLTGEVTVLSGFLIGLGLGHQLGMYDNTPGGEDI